MALSRGRKLQLHPGWRCQPALFPLANHLFGLLQPHPPASPLPSPGLVMLGPEQLACRGPSWRAEPQTPRALGLCGGDHLNHPLLAGPPDQTERLGRQHWCPETELSSAAEAPGQKPCEAPPPGARHAAGPHTLRLEGHLEWRFQEPPFSSLKVCVGGSHPLGLTSTVSALPCPDNRPSPMGVTSEPPTPPSAPPPSWVFLARAFSWRGPAQTLPPGLTPAPRCLVDVLAASPKARHLLPPGTGGAAALAHSSPPGLPPRIWARF